MSEKKDDSSTSDSFSVRKYFLHGVFFSLLMSGFTPFVFLVDWIVSYESRPLTIEPFFVLIVIVYVFLGLFIVLGGIDSYIAGRLWSIQTPQTWQEALGHGAVLFLFLCLIQLPVVLAILLLTSMLPGGHFATNEQATIVVYGLSVLITPIPNGIVCRLIAAAQFRVDSQHEV